MKATRPGPVIGIALERLASGPGEVTAFVHRGWHGGGEALAAKEHELAELRQNKDRQIVELESRLEAVEGVVNRLATGSSPKVPDSELRLVARGNARPVNSSAQADRL